MFLLSACSFAESSFTYQERPDYKVSQPQSKPINIENVINQGQMPDSQNSNLTSPSNSQETRNYAGEIKKAERRKVKVTEVVDSDTIKYYDSALGKVVTARLIGINGPEYTKEVQYLGKESTQFLTTLILGKEIEIEGDPNADMTDRYGRYLIHAFIGGKSIQQILLMEGLVRLAYIYSNYRYIDTYEEAETAAKEAGLNIWSIPGYVDSKNGFNMDVIKSGVETKLNEKISDVKEIIKRYLP